MAAFNPTILFLGSCFPQIFLLLNPQRTVRIEVGPICRGVVSTMMGGYPESLWRGYSAGLGCTVVTSAVSADLGCAGDSAHYSVSRFGRVRAFLAGPEAAPPIKAFFGSSGPVVFNATERGGYKDQRALQHCRRLVPSRHRVPAETSRAHRAAGGKLLPRVT